jgi:hypothetical protein
MTPNENSDNEGAACETGKKGSERLNHQAVTSKVTPRWPCEVSRREHWIPRLTRQSLQILPCQI